MTDQVVDGKLAVSGTLAVAGTSTFKSSLDATGNLQINGSAFVFGTLTVDGALTVSDDLGVGTNAPTHKLHVKTRDAVGLFESTGSQAYLRLSTKEGHEHRVEITNRPGGRLSLWTSIGKDVLNITRDGDLGIGTTEPTHKFHVKTGNAVGLFESTGSQAYLRLSTKEGHDHRVEITNRPGGRLSLWTKLGGDALNITRDGKVGIGTIRPAMTLDVNGRIFRKGKAFSSSGVATHGQLINPPWGNRNDWNIFVSPNELGLEEGRSEKDNAMLVIRCWATPRGNGWEITASCKYRLAGDGRRSSWLPGKANYILIPR